MKKSVFKSIFVVVFISLLSFYPLCATDLEIGKTYHGFKFIKEKKIKEYNVVGKVFTHLKSGARLLKMETNDDNKTFMIGFKTPPDSDTGLPHIMEHSVLNGSKNFPVKSPFDVLMKGSLRTFLNAMTSSDKTQYPVSSRNDKDYFNLMHVYLDAVFFPRFYDEPKIFKQEGWHYELESKDADIKYNGVVYNEMKGAFSSPNRELYYVVDKNLFPNNCYGYSSGGYPEAIPRLTYEKFLSFHKRYYHPSNSYIYLYGDHNVLEELKFINEKYLSKFDKIEIDSSINLQKSFEKPKEVVADYSITKDEKTQNQTYLNLSMVTDDIGNRDLVMALSVLQDALVNLPSAPIRKALQDSGIGKDVNGYVDRIKQPVFGITVTKANPEDKEKFKNIVYATLKKVVKEGLDKKVLEGIINQMEFDLREGRGGYKGLIIGMQANNGWMFTDNPFLYLEFEEPLKKLKTALTSRYLENIIKENLINNKHVLLTILKPKKGLMEEKQAKLKKELAEYKTSLSEKEKEELIKQTKELKAYQRKPDSQEALETIPLLSLEDIENRADYYEIKKSKIKNIDFLTYPVFANNIIYAKYLFNAFVVPQDKIPYISLLANILGELNTKNYSYGELNTEINIHTGGINTYLTTYLKDNNTKKMMPKFVVSGKVMSPKLNKFLELCSELVTNTIYDDKERLKKVLTKHQAQVESMVMRNGLGVALTRLFSYFSINGQYEELTRGLSYYRFITNLTDNYEQKYTEIVANLKSMTDKIFNKSSLQIAVTASEDDIGKFKEQSGIFLDDLESKKLEPIGYGFQFKNKNEGITSASKVQYVLQGYNYKDLGYEYTGKMAILNQILSRDYLQKQVRVIGGAYGGFAGFSKNGMVYFGSYRDPNLEKTLDNYKKSVEFLKNFSANKRAMTRFIIGTLAKYERPLTASQEGSTALNNYYTGITAEDVQKERNEILNTTPEDIQNFAKLVEKIISKNLYCVYGNEKKLNDAKHLFTRLIKARK